MKKLLIILFVAFLLNYESISQINSDIFRFYPLGIGNTWVYNGSGWAGQYIKRIKVIGSTVINQHLYHKLNNNLNNDTTYVRIDSTKGLILFRNTSNSCSWLNQETTGDSIAAKINDSSSVRCNERAACTDTANEQIFSLIKERKIFYNQYFEGTETRKYVMDFGSIQIYTTGPTWYYTWILKGCIINGIVYGDTSLTGLNKISSEVPESFSLSQNYPNPFNPTTKIRFSIPQVGNGRDRSARIIVYDILGREIQTLVNEQLSPGTYEVEFDGTNYPSGVYFYTLKTGNFLANKKMILLK